MSSLYQSRRVACTYSRAQQLLEENLAKDVSEGRPRRTPLRARLGGREIERDVAIVYGRATDPMHFDRPWSVHWQPADGGPYPSFDGTLTVRADEDYGTCALELMGSYDPPFGVAGRAFDSIAGSRIANASARDYLRRIAERLETQYREEEGEKSDRRFEAEAT